MERYSKIEIRDGNRYKKVRIGSVDKPQIDEGIIERWQSLIDTVARLAKVPSGLIMRLNEQTIEVFLKSLTNGNPYKRGEKVGLDYGLYCETVIGTQEKLVVPDATKSHLWSSNNPDVDIDMISYMGVPVNWPDGEVFGTVCLLDNKENYFNREIEDLLEKVKQYLESDLQLIVLNSDLKAKNTELEQLNNTKSRFLSLISHDIRGNIATTDEFLKLILADFGTFETQRLRLILESLSENVSSTREALENLLSWSKKDLVHLTPDTRPVDIIALLDSILLYFSRYIQVKEIIVKKSYYSDEAFLRTDENMITVALRNIISNAIKYNQKGGELKVKVDYNNSRHEITITDNGPGMDKETVEGLFRYSNRPAGKNQDESGAGIGLILTKEFLDKLGAVISIDSTPGGGTSIRVLV